MSGTWPVGAGRAAFVQIGKTAVLFRGPFVTSAPPPPDLVKSEALGRSQDFAAERE
jgi:hypothetical protein